MVEGTKFIIFIYGTYVRKDAMEHEIRTRGNNDSLWMSGTTWTVYGAEPRRSRT